MKRFLFGLPLFLLSLIAVSWGVKKFKEFSLFEIREVVVKGNTEIDFAGLIGKNIFDIDTRDLKAEYENEKTKLVNVRKLFPGRVMLEVKGRTPFAIVELRESHEIDSEGFIMGKPRSKNLPGAAPGVQRKNLPVIKVFSVSKDSAKRSSAEIWKLKSKKIMDVIHLFIKDFGSVKEVRVYDDDLVIKSDKEIHLGRDRWIERIEKLTHISWTELDGYEIDLRFRNQIIVK